MDLGDKEEILYQVQSSDLAKALSTAPQDDFPEVYATSKMVALMELAAARLMKPLLTEGELSVGVNVNVTHMATTPNNVEVKAVATFDVALYDPAGEAGKGTHTRAIIKTERFVQGAMSRT